MPSIDRIARFMHGNRAERAPHVLSQSGPLSNQPPGGSTPGGFSFLTPRLSPILCADQSATASDTSHVSRPTPWSLTAPSSPSRASDVATSHETCDAALGATAESKRSAGSSIRIPRRMTLDDRLAGLAVLAAVLGSIGFTIYSIVQKALT